MAAQEDEYKKYYAPQYNGSPIDYNAAAQPEFDAYEAFMQQLRPKVDPVMQEKQDKQLAYGKAFWAGANMLGNVISNIMNVNAVKAGAPSAQTYNSDAENRMYQQWHDIDRNLRAERRAAQERYDAAGMSLAKLKSGIAMKEAEQKQKIDDENFKINAANKRLADAMDAVREQHKDWSDADIYNYVTSNGKILPNSEIQKQRQEANEDYKERAKAQANANAAVYNARHSDEKKPKSMYFSSSDGTHEYTIDATDEKDFNKKRARVKALVANYVNKHSEDKFKKKVWDKENLEYVDAPIKADDIKDLFEIIDTYNLLDDEVFRKDFEKAIGIQSTTPQPGNGSGSGTGYRMPGQ